MAILLSLACGLAAQKQIDYQSDWGERKHMQTKFCFIPVDVILGEMYLETEQFDKAASHYTTSILTDNPAYSDVQVPIPALSCMGCKNTLQIPGDLVP